MDVNSTQRTGALVRRLLPAGRPLSDPDWELRHRTLSVVALLHAPALVLFNVFVGTNWVHTVEESVPVAAFAILGTRRRSSRRVRELTTTLALSIASAALVHASGGLIEAHFHFFVVVAMVTLYQQWAPFGLAIVFVLVHHGIAGTIDPSSVYNHEAAVNSPWVWAGVHALFISMATAVGLANWKLNESARLRAESYYRELYEGKQALIGRLEEANRVKSELVAAVSHEFRTPLTAILGLLQTVETKPDLDPQIRTDMTARAGRQAKRLERLVVNLLETERPLDASGGSCDAAQAVQDAAVAAEGRPDGVTLHVDARPGLRLPLSHDAANLVLTNLINNAMKFADPGTAVEVRCRPAPDDHVTIEVANQGVAIPLDKLEHIFEPFVQADSSSTRSVDGVGLGLHLVRRTVRGHGGRVEVTCHWGVTTFSVTLPPSVDQAGPTNAASSLATSAGSSHIGK